MLKWTCDRNGNWHQVWRAVVMVDGRLVEVPEVKGRAAA